MRSHFTALRVDARINYAPERAEQLVKNAVEACEPPTQLELAARMGITRQHLYHIARGSRAMKYEFQVMLECIISDSK